MEPKRLTLKEMCYIVAVFGDDIPQYKRERLWRLGSVPAIAGIIREGEAFVERMNARRREPHPTLRIS